MGFREPSWLEATFFGLIPVISVDINLPNSDRSQICFGWHIRFVLLCRLFFVFVSLAPTFVVELLMFVQ